MKVIGAGLSRTGTMSTQAALEQLGYPCYHMSEVASSAKHLHAWEQCLSGQSEMVWSDLFADFLACVDTPCCLYFREIMAAFPDAKVLLNLRDPANWYDSLVALSTALEEFRSQANDHPNLAAFLHVTDMVGIKLTHGDFSRDNCIEAFHRHNNRVMQQVPANRLLVFHVKDGWEPLCEFLGEEVPDTPFPHLNEGRETIRQIVNDKLLASSE